MGEFNRSQPTLIGIPLEILEKIVMDDEDDWETMFALRNVCKTLRRKMSAINPDLKAINVEFNVTTERIELHFPSIYDFRTIVSSDYRSLDSFFHDVKVVLDHLNSTLTFFDIRLLETVGKSKNDENLMNFLEEYLSSRTSKLEVEQFEINNFDNAIPILSNLHEEFIQRVSIRTSKTSEPRVKAEELKIIDIEEIQQLQQWKNANIVVKDFWVKNSVLNFTECVLMECYFLTVSVDDLRFIRDMFIRDSSKRHHTIHLNEPIHGDEEALGPFIQNGSLKDWYYRTGEPHRFVHLRQFDPLKYEFSLTHLRNLPQNAIVQ